MTDLTRFCQKELAISLALALSLVHLSSVQANDACTVVNGVQTCQGDQSTGISVTAPPSTLNVLNLSGPIQPIATTPGIQLQSSGGSDLTVNSGTAQANVGIVTTQAPGISVLSKGTPSTPQNDPLLGVPIPGTAGVSGGVGQINSYSDITTSGTNAHGITVQSSTTGYSQSAVVDPLQVLSNKLSNGTSGISFTVSTVENPDGSSGSLGTPITGTLIYNVPAPTCDTSDPNCKFDPTTVTSIEGETGGAFTVNSNGTFSFDPGSAFNDLAAGASRATSVQYVLNGTRDVVNVPEQGEIIAIVTNIGTTDSPILSTTYAVNFPQQFGYISIPTGTDGQPDAAAFPDLQTYVNGLIATANGAGGAGNSVTVNSLAGTIATTGQSADGIFAESKGAPGGHGANGGGFWSFGTQKPSGGGTGNNGGSVTVTADGTITTGTQGDATGGLNSIGVFAHSMGGNGGGGGDGGTWYYGRMGGTGGAGGNVAMSGDATITTWNENAIGIYALSDGGDGGAGGEGHGAMGAGNGGAGGKGGTVVVDGTWTITTNGEAAYGIWAKSIGGKAGSGGSGGWMGGSSGNGGQASDGGTVTLTLGSGGMITTHGIDAFGLFAQSIGGFGGSGGAGGSIFDSKGGFGGRAGSGGNVTLTNRGDVVTSNNGAHAIYAQSIGGSGGVGGRASGIVAVGGEGGDGGDGGTVYAENDGTITTYGDDARGIYAQSVGGGGGDGGSAGGVVALGGRGAGDGKDCANASGQATCAPSIGGQVTVINNGSISTGKVETDSEGKPIVVDGKVVVTGAGSNAIYAQSIGGGGGSGGSSSGWFSVGGDGGGGGSGGKITVENSGDLTTLGADASAIFAQSVGGGGGNGGGSIAAGLFTSMAIGGAGGLGGNGDVVSIMSTAGNISTTGDRSDGIFAQSIGGGGGNGGFAGSVSFGIGASFSLAVGGQGGGGGNAGTVAVDNQSTIGTTGDNAVGVFAQSAGGGGGNGGFAIAGAVSDGVSASLTIGGKGASGGASLDAGTAGTADYRPAVQVTNSGSITTTGQNAQGIVAQSIGGGGGNGGFSLSAGAGLGSVSLGFGGPAGGGGQAGTVWVSNAGKIETGGDNSSGLLAQSLGGGGGNGGFSVAAGGGALGAASLSFGGKGGSGGTAGTVTLDNTADIRTLGNFSSAIDAQSVGGGGGNGGFSVAAGAGGLGAATLTFGGAAGAGGTGKAVTVTSVGNLTTGTDGGPAGVMSHGIFAESIGGGGGQGGFAVSASAGGYGAVSLGFGGAGGNGGNAGTVTVDNNLGSATNHIVTYNAMSDGIFAQSLGGSGGAGGFAGSVAGAGYGAVSLAFGGGGGSGGDADQVRVNSEGAIVTWGAKSNAIFAQSVGGGGGDGGFALSASGSQYGNLAMSFGGDGGNAGEGKAVSVESAGDTRTYGDQSTAIFAQSVGGGGGNGGFAVSGTLTLSSSSASASLSVGGKGGTGATAGTAHVGNTGAIMTSGLNSDGILAQSIGGSGGNGGFSGALNLAAGGVAYTSSIGGNGGSGNAGGAVDVESTGNITTGGDNSTGIFAQSVGGGGGNGGFSLTLAASMKGAPDLPAPLNSPPKSVGGSGGTGGTGGTVSVTSDGQIYTSGNLADGILSQSVGGGGGRAGFAAGAGLSWEGGADINTVGGDGGSGNDAAQVSVKATAGASGYSVVTVGNGSNGILAQSVGGGGGAGGFSVAVGVSAKDAASASSVGGTGGAGGSSLNSGSSGDAGYVAAVQVTNTGSILTGGMNADGILAQSVGGGGGNGGFSVSGSFSFADDADSKGQSVGGSGGSGGTGGDVIVRSNATAASGAVIETVKDLSYGIQAQSVGGGGGNGGFAISGSLSLKGSASAQATGGDGTGGNHAGDVTVETGGMIVTRGEGSGGILAQSVGGGGGSGGFAGGLSIGLSGTASTNVTGGNGGSGSDGRTVQVTTLDGSSITTYGDNATGVLAQSVGGGGGNGGFSISLGVSKASEGTGSTDDSDTSSDNNSVGGQSSTGGDGGKGGIGHDVTVTNVGTIWTEGYLSNGILAQSVGGGGGNGGFAVSGDLALKGSAATNGVGGAGGNGGTAGTVTVNNSGTITVQKAGTIGILAQSVGGGGGTGGFAGTISLSVGDKATTNSVGGNGGTGNDGGIVSVTNSGAITAAGDQGIGILAQSVGGGGGNGAFAVTLAGSMNSNSSTDSGASSDAGGGDAGSVANSVGGSGGAGGAGQAVIVTNNVGGNIITNGAMAYGIEAQSVGGGGGNGGFSLGGSLSLSGDATSTIGGGGGGAGSIAGDVSVFNYGQVEAQGTNSIGILAQSIGGGGGSGGFAGGLSFSSGGKVSNTVGGGAGGVGGSAGAVTVTNEDGATIWTQADNSIGILAQAVGGGGGNGAFSISAGAATNAEGMAQSVGGQGGTGGSVTAPVTVTNNGIIETDGALSHGIYAQSVGGGGGNGGISVAGTYASSGGATSTVGGAGASGGDGGTVEVHNNGTIVVNGRGSVGIFAQSVGGGGGSAGFSGALNFTGGGELTNTIGGGGSGGNGGDVTVISTGSIITTSADSISVLAQSIGGGGGNGTFSVSVQDGALDGAALIIGASNTGTPGTNGTVTETVSGGSLVTAGALSYGILSQAIGAGGGNGALSVDDPLTVGAAGISQFLGATGNASGNGSLLDVTNSNPIITDGAGSAGFIGQSIGGGGGTSGVAGDVVFTEPGPMSLTLGGTTTGGGTGGTASLSNTASYITTSGDAAAGILGQAIGGGGGSAIYAFGTVTGSAGQVTETLGGAEGSTEDGGTITVTTSGAVSTQGRVSPGIVSQSIGGGGGLSAMVAPSGMNAAGLDVTLGSTGGTGGNGMAVDLFSQSLITTTQAGSVGILAQSIGGGGGIAQVFGVSGSGPIILGASGGAGGDGGALTLTSIGDITTSGVDADAIIAQSIGGGGGAFIGFDSTGTPLQMQVTAGTGGGGGNGSMATVTSFGAIATTGAGANGIVAQSIGGGGGLVGGGALTTTLSTSGSFAGSVGGAGDGGPVTVSLSGSITTQGDQANGILAQSAGGQGTGGVVHIAVKGDVSATGEGSHGIFAQSRGNAGAGDIAINVMTGTVQGGYGTVQEVSNTGVMSEVLASGVRFEDGANNSLINHGTVTTATGVAGMAISGTGGNEAIDNFGTITGSVDLGTGTNSFHNEQAALFNSGATLNLGTGNLLTNDGTLSPGGMGNVMTASIAGNLAQSTTGIYALDLDQATGTADRLDVSGIATIAGQVQLSSLNSGYVKPGFHQLNIISAAGGVTDLGLGLVTAPSAVINYQLLFPDSTDAALGYSVDFAPAGVNKNQAAIGHYINNVQAAGGSARLAPVVEALVGLPDTQSLAVAYDHLSPEPYLGIRTGMMFSSLDFSDAMHSCSVRDGSDRFIREGECSWLQLAGGKLMQESTAEFMGFNRKSNNLSGGMQRAVGDGSWHAGFGLSYEQSTLNVDNLANTSGNQGQVGAILKKSLGATSLAADLSASYGSYDTDRYVNFPAPNVTATSSQQVKFVAGHLRLAHAYASGANGYVKPMLDLGVSHGWFPGFQESGAGGANLNVQSHDETYVNVTPALEIGGETELAGGELLRPYAKLGVTQFLSGTSPVITASFQGAPAGVAPITVEGEMDQTYADVDVGLYVLYANGFILRSGYIGKFSGHLISNGGMVMLSIPF